MPCFRFWAATMEGVVTLQQFACGSSAGFASIPGHDLNGAYLIIDGAAIPGLIYWGPPHARRGVETADPNNIPSGWGIGGNCDACKNPPPPPVSRYDCINGSCVDKGTYSTPGFYESLAACEQNCGPGCGGHCISNEDLAKIRKLAAMVKNNKDCS